jgi:hypothetical protein
MDSPFYLNLVQQTLQQTTQVMPNKFHLDTNYDLIQFEEGYEKPPRDLFYAKYNELLRNVHLDRLRSQRNEKLRQSDFSMLPDYRLSRENEEEWKIYRQSLRDIPSTTEDPENPVWPEPPQVEITSGHTQLEGELQIAKDQAHIALQTIADMDTRLRDHENSIQTLTSMLEEERQKFQDTRLRDQENRIDMERELQDVDSQLQSEKKKSATLELVVASLLSRVGDLEKRIA